MLTTTTRRLSALTVLGIAAGLGFGAVGAASAMPGKTAGKTLVTTTKYVEPGWHAAHAAVTWRRPWQRRRWGAELAAQ